MKKLAVLAVFGVLGVFYSTMLYAVDIKLEGDVRVRGIYSDNLTDAKDKSAGAFDDQQAFGDGRVRLRTTATAGITSLVLTVDFSNAFNDPSNPFCPDDGVAPSADACGTGNYRFGTVTLGNSYNIVGVREGYLKIDLPRLDLALGRKQYKLGHGIILDDTADAIATKFMLGPVNVLLANAKLLESNSSGSGVGQTGSDADLYAANFGLQHGDDHAVSLFVTYVNDRDDQLTLPAGIADQTDLWTVGFTADGTFGPVNAMFEVDFLTGKIDFPGASDLDLEGLNILAGGSIMAGPANVGLTLIYASGDDPGDPTSLNVNGISANYVLGNILINDNINSDRDGQCLSVDGGRFGAGSRGCVGGSGLLAVKASADIGGMPTKDCHNTLALIWAQTAEDPAVGVGVDKDLGIEIDLNHKHTLDENVNLTINLGYLMSGDAWKTLAAGDDDQLKGIVAVNYMF